MAIDIHPNWYEHPKVKASWSESNGNVSEFFYILLEKLEATERLWEEISRRGGNLEQVLDRVNTIASSEVQGADSIEEIKELLLLGFTQKQIRAMFGGGYQGAIEKTWKAYDGHRAPMPGRATLGVTDAQIVKAYRSGKSVHDVGRHLHVDEHRVRAVVQASGVPRHPGGPKVDGRRRAIAKLAEQGLSAAAIGREIGITSKNVLNHLKVLGFRPVGSGNVVRWVRPLSEIPA